MEETQLNRVSICVVCDSFKIEDREYIYQLISKATQLANDIAAKVIVIGMGIYSNGDIEEIFAYGADEIYWCKTEIVNPSEATNLVEKLLSELLDLKLVMFTNTILGQTVAAMVSTRLAVGLTAECIDIKMDNGTFIFIRSAINSSVLVQIITQKSKFGMCTVKNNTFCQVKRKEYKVGYINYIESNYENQNSTFSLLLQQPKKIDKHLDLDNAKIIFGCGRGITISNSFELLKKVASKYKAEIVCTRPIVEDSVLEYTRQVGQSGRSIRPDIYIAFGISGASQHMVGIKNAKLVVAVNNDENAKIFDYANYKIVEDATIILHKMLLM